MIFKIMLFMAELGHSWTTIKNNKWVKNSSLFILNHIIFPKSSSYSFSPSLTHAIRRIQKFWLSWNLHESATSTQGPQITSSKWKIFIEIYVAQIQPLIEKPYLQSTIQRWAMFYRWLKKLAPFTHYTSRYPYQNLN